MREIIQERRQREKNAIVSGLRHRAVAVFIINSKNQVLLQKRSEMQKMWPGMWDLSSGGHVDSGEQGFQAIQRELHEELGLDIQTSEMDFIGSALSTNIKGDIINKHLNEYYVVNKDIDLESLKLQATEVSEVKWVDKEEIIERIKNNYEGITDKKGAWNYLLKYYELQEKKVIKQKNDEEVER